MVQVEVPIALAAVSRWEHPQLDGRRSRAAQAVGPPPSYRVVVGLPTPVARWHSSCSRPGASSRCYPAAGASGSGPPTRTSTSSSSAPLPDLHRRRTTAVGCMGSRGWPDWGGAAAILLTGGAAGIAAASLAVAAYRDHRRSILYKVRVVDDPAGVG